MPKTNTDIEHQAIQIVKDEYTNWEDATAFVTEKVAFNMRNLIRKCRKNYYGVFDTPQDPATGRDKIWVHLTQEFVDAMRKNADLDTKDINFKAKHPSAIGKAKIVRSIFHNYLDRTHFGEDLDELITNIGVDGTAVWQTVEEKDPQTKRMTAKRIPVDLLNVYIDPTARSIQEAYRFTVRHLMTADEVKAQKGWMNTDDIKPSVGLSRIEPGFNGTTGTAGSKYVDVWQMHGKAPKSLITGKEEDTEEIDIRIICSGLEKAGDERVHLIEKYDGLKPYEEVWLFRVPGRWYGMGVAEKLLMYQLWANTVVNIRITRSYVSQLGIFKIKKGSGITPQMLSKLASNGAVQVNDIGDIEQFQMNEASEASYKDEEVIQTRSQRVTGTYEAATGESLPSSTPATNAVIQQNASQSGYTLIKEGIGFFLERWIKRHALPIEMKAVRLGDLIRMELDPEDLRRDDEAQVNDQITQQIDALTEQGIAVDPMQVEMERQRALAKLQSYGTDRFKRYDEQETIDCEYFDVEVFITNEKMDKGVLSQNLLLALQAAPEYKQQILQAIFDLSGVDIKMEPQPIMPQMMSPQGAGGAPPSQNPQQVTTQANTGQAMGI